MMTDYFRPLVQQGPQRPDEALSLAGGPYWFTHVVHHSRNAPARVIPARDVPQNWSAALTASRPPVAGMHFDRPVVMGILNVTPDSFSDGGVHNAAQDALTRAKAMVQEGAGLIDIGGESTRPGAETVAIDEEIARTAPVIAALAPEIAVPISIDTRKTAVAEAAVSAGAHLVNDVSGFTYDTGLAPYCAQQGLPICVMHAQGDPETMQQDPQYDDVLLDVYDFLAERVAFLTAAGIARDQIIVDPGIGFGKTLAHNLTLLSGLSLFHGLGCPILLGASRKGFVGTITGANPASERVHGSVAIALDAAAQGVQILRVHDVEATVQALTMSQAITIGDFE